MKRLSALAMFGLAIATAMPVAAQQRQTTQAPKDTTPRPRQVSIPADARPPKGMCRIWIDNVPATQQPAATDCPTAIKNLPANGRVIFGDEYSDTTAKKGTDKPKLPPNVKGFTDLKPNTPILPKRPPQD